MAKTQFNVEQFKTEAVKPLFAVAGATELAVELARGYATEAQKATQERFTEVQTRVSDVQARVAKVELEPKSLQTTLQAQARTRVEELKSEAKDAQARFEARVADLQKDARDFPAKFEALLNDALEELNATYADLAVRGEKFVAAIRKDGVKAVTTVKPAPAPKSTAKAPAKKASAKKASAKKAPAKKKAPKTAS
jgi:DNA repair exonuclease SbcCD ATPase subunit